MPETELTRALQELTPEPPRFLRAAQIADRARVRRRVRVTALTVVPVAAVAVTAFAVVTHPAARSTGVIGVPQPVPSTSTTPPTVLPPVTDMHAETGSTVTGGRADMDGDGVPDTVRVDSETGGVVIDLANGTSVRAQLPVPFQRLQGLPDLFNTGTRQVLLYSSAAGCCGYAPSDSQSLVLTIVDDELVVIRGPGGQPLQLYFSAGRGDVYAGVACVASSHSVVQEQIVPGASRRLTTITLSGATAHEVAETPRSYPLRQPVDFEVSRECVGLRPDGRAS